MMRLIWVDGRFAWPVVLGLLFVTVSVLTVDFVWRVIVIPFDQLVIYAAVLDMVAAALLIVGYAAFNRRKSWRSRL